MIGVAASVALLLDHAWFGAGAAAGPRRGAAELTGLAALLMGFAHLVHGPATSWLVGRHYFTSATDFKAYAKTLRDRIGDTARAEVVVVRGMGASFFMPFALDERGAPPARWRMLAQTGHALAMRRGPRTLDLIVPRGQSLYPIDHANLFRSQASRLQKGDVLQVPGVRATIVEASRKGPRVVRFDFERELESPPLFWISERFRGFHEAPLPELGFGQPFDP